MRPILSISSGYIFRLSGRLCSARFSRNTVRMTSYFSMGSTPGIIEQTKTGYNRSQPLTSPTPAIHCIEHPYFSIKFGTPFPRTIICSDHLHLSVVFFTKPDKLWVTSLFDRGVYAGSFILNVIPDFNLFISHFSLTASGISCLLLSLAFTIFFTQDIHIGTISSDLLS